MRAFRSFLLVHLAVLFLGCVPGASALTLDPTYGIGGQSVPFAPPQTTKWRYIDSTMRVDGSVAVLFSSPNSRRFGIYSVAPDGTPDSQFGNQGWRHGSFIPGARAVAEAITAYPDGRLAVLARRTTKRSWSLVTQRINRDGRIDRDFIRKLPQRGKWMLAGDLAVDNANRLVVSYAADARVLGAFRIGSDGDLDQKYGQGARGKGNEFDTGRYYGTWPEGLALLPDGSAVTGGWIMTDYCDDPEECPAGPSSTEEPLVIKLDRHGIVSRAFGAKGRLHLNLDFDSVDLKIAAAGDKFYVSVDTANGISSYIQAWGPELRRFSADGDLDRAFSGTDGANDSASPRSDPEYDEEEDQWTRGLSVSRTGEIALCGAARRFIKNSQKLKSRYDFPGYLQVFDPISAAAVMLPAANYVRDGMRNQIENCAWTADEKLLSIDMRNSLVVKSYLK